MLPEPGDFACVHTAGDTGMLITIGEYLNRDGSRASYFDHAEIYIGQPDSAAPYGYTMGAYPGGARLVPLSQSQVADSISPGHLWSTGKITLTGEQRQRIVALALACQGIGYSWADYLALAAHRLHVPVPGLKEYIASSGHMICSQMVDWCYMQAGVHLFTDGRWPGYVTPAALAGLFGLEVSHA